jgi:hypothetical protein
MTTIKGISSACCIASLALKGCSRRDKGSFSRSNCRPEPAADGTDSVFHACGIVTNVNQKSSARQHYDLGPHRRLMNTANYWINSRLVSLELNANGLTSPESKCLPNSTNIRRVCRPIDAYVPIPSEHGAIELCAIGLQVNSHATSSLVSTAIRRDCEQHRGSMAASPGLV